MKIILIVAMTLGLASSPRSAPHKFEDDFVERTLAIVIRDNVATAEYSIGLNESTLNQLLDQWEKEAALKQPTPSKSSTAHPAQSPDDSKSDTQTKTFIAPKPVSKTKISESNSAIQSAAKVEPNDHEKSSSEHLPTSPGSTSQSSAKAPIDGSSEESDQDKSEPHDDENPIHERLLVALKKNGPDQIAQRIVVTCDGQPLKIKDVTASPAARHPFILTVKFEFEIPPLKSAKLEISDKNFRHQTGAVRYAIKALGSTMLVKSNKAPIIIRAQRVELAGLSEKETISETSISAKILLMSNSDKED